MKKIDVKKQRNTKGGHGHHGSYSYSRPSYSYCGSGCRRHC